MPPVPRSGKGTIFINRTVDGDWEASCQEGPAIVNQRGTLEEVTAWARSQPAAARLVIPPGEQYYQPLDGQRP